METFQYPKIHMKRTGIWLHCICRMRGKSVRLVQEMLGLSTVQSVYDWFHGRTLPSLDNMCALGQLLDMPVEALLIGEYGIPLLWFSRLEAGQKALFHYRALLSDALQSKILQSEEDSHKTSHRVEEESLYDCFTVIYVPIQVIDFKVSP